MKESLPVHELLPGILHWTTFHEVLHTEVSSYYVEPAGALIDARVPEEGLEVFAGRVKPQQVIATSGHHVRHADRFAQAFGCLVRIPLEARERKDGSLDSIAGVESAPYNDHDEIAPQVRAIKIGKLAPDEYALHVELAGGAICFADALVHYGGALGFVPDPLIGAHPDRVKAGLKEAFRGVLERDFKHLLFAHGPPLLREGKTMLRRFVEKPVGYPEYGQVL